MQFEALLFNMFFERIYVPDAEIVVQVSMYCAPSAAGINAPPSAIINKNVQSKVTAFFFIFRFILISFPFCYKMVKKSGNI
ncbi:Uncharacterised protein [uncultured archaeon]|nr:Uncharacterised protein [uncultured archaeon]